MRAVVLIALVCLAGCSWFGARKASSADPAELIVTGAPAGCLVFVDGMPAGEAVTINDHPQVVTVTSGTHKVEIHMAETVVYREEIYVAQSEHRVVTVLSGISR